MLDAGPGRGALDAIWRIAARAEAAANKGQKVATVSWGLQAFCQATQHAPLLRRAERLGFPMALARLAVRLYSAPRYFATEGHVVDPVRPNKGVLLGCGWAMTLVKVYYKEPQMEVLEQHPTVALNVTVDDLQVLGPQTRW